MKRAVLATIALLGLVQACPAHAADVRMYIRHDVTDYAAWRKVYDGFDAERRGMGVSGHAVYRSVDNPNDVTVWHDFKSAEAAKAFASSPNLKGTMQNAGVKGPPSIWFVIPADK
jgi:quinol monooxygenase YgiN